MTIEEVRENFTKGMILRFAISNISNPIEGLKRVKEHLETTLTDENLAKVFNMTIEEVRESFSRWTRLYFAISNISNPIEGLKRVKEHLETTLTDENLAKVFNMTIEEVRENFTKGMRLYFAINNISNPIKGLQRWLEGKIKAPFKKPTIKP
jgi:tRNA(Phe) wybutosine-synthesizing methylase Tyw3